MAMRRRYAILGMLWGLGAPLGSLAWRVVASGPPNIALTLAHEWQTAAYYYVYMTVGTIVAFGIFGYAVGRRDEALDNLSMTDGLTGLYNHRYVQEQLSQEIKRSDRYHSPLTCLMIDLDDFKQVNDHYGHPLGDIVLKTTGQLISTSVRQTDIVGRYGGEEFLILMPHTNTETAHPLAQRILKTVQSHAFSANGDIFHITLSIGLATYPSPVAGIKTKSALLSAADQALYRAKRTGKNQTVIWQ
jgi:diguanylate cyclase (GGDEF)-like protein